MPAIATRLRRVGRSIVALIALAGTWTVIVSAARAQQLVTINETFTGSSISSDWVLAKKPGTPFTPVLTASSAGNNIDANGSGWLRLTDAATWEATYAYNNQAFNGANATISTTFKYASYGGNGADGITFFLADASKTFAVGAYGGSLGYAQMTAAGGAVDTNGMNGGYIGLGIDEYGNYSAANEGKVGGFGTSIAQGSYPNAIAVRGPGDGLTGYDYLGGTGPSGTQLSFNGASRPTGDDERTIQINITATNQLTVFLQAGASAPLEELYNIDLSGFARPDQLIMGFTAGTGGLTNIHEIQGLQLASLEASRWTNAGGTSTWGSGSNWNGTNGLIPAVGADVLLNNAFVNTAQTIDVGGTRSIRSLQVDAPFSYTLNNGTLQFNHQGVLGPSGIFVSQGNGAANHTINSAIVTDNAIEIKNSSAGTLALTGTVNNNGNSITLNGTGSTTLSGVVSGSGALTKNGTGNATLSASNTYSGGTTVKAGTLTVGNNNALGSGNVTFTGGTLASNASNTVANDLSLQGNAGLSNITTSGTLTQSGANRTLSLSGATHSGAINLSENNTGRTLTVQVDNGTSTISGSIQNGGTSAGNLTKTGQGVLLLSGSNIYTGTTTINAGTLRSGINDTLSTSSGLHIAGGTFDLNQLSQKVNSLSFSNNGTLDFGATGTANTFVFDTFGGTTSGVLTIRNWNQGAGDFFGSTTAGLTQTTLDMLYFSGYGPGATEAGTTTSTIYGNAYAITPTAVTGTTWTSNASSTWGTNGNWNSGVGPQPNSATALANFGFANPTNGTQRTVSLEANKMVNGIRFDSAANGSYTINGAFTLTLSAGSANGLSFVQQQSTSAQTLGAATTTLALTRNTVFDVTNTGNLTVGALITGATSLVKEGSGSGKLILTNNNTGYTGNVFVEAGTLQITNAGALGTTAGTTSISDGATLELNNNTGIAVAEAFSLQGLGISSGGAIRSTTGGAATNTLSGTLTLNGESRINSDAGTLALSGNVTGTNRNLYLGGAGNLTLSGTLTTGTGNTTVDSTGTVTFSGAAANTASGTTSVNSGTLVLSKTAGVNAVAGNLVVGDGVGAASTATVRLGAANQVDNRSGLTINSDGRFDLNGSSETIASLAGSGRVDNSAAGNATLTFGDINSTTFSGVIEDTGAGSLSLVKQGPGKTTLTGTNLFTGTTTLNNGILAVQSSGALSNTAVTIANGANLEVSGGISLANAVTLSGSGTLAGDGAIQSTAGNNTFTGAITLGAASEIQADAGTLTLSGASAIVSTGGTRDLTFDGAGNITVSKVIGNALNNIGAVTKNGAGTLTLSGANLYNGATNINDGNLVASGGAAIGDTSAVTVASGATFTSSANNETIGSIAGAGTVALGTGAVTLTAGGANTSTTFSGAVTGGATTTFQKNGSGTLTLSGSSSLAGNVNLNGGGLLLSNASGASLGSINNLTVGTGTTLTFGANDQINDNATLTLAGGTVNLGGFSDTLRSVSQTAASTIDFLNDGSTLRFNGVTGTSSGLGTIAGGTLTIANWAGSLAGGGTEQFVIYSPSAPTLTNINFANWGLGNNATAIARGDLGAGYYELVPVVSVTDWNVNGNGNWNVLNGGNWVGGVTPNAIGAFVRFGNLGSAAPLTTNPTVSLTANQIVGTLIFDNSANRSYTIGGASRLDFDVASGSAQIVVDDNGSHTISAATRYMDSTVVTNNSNAATGLTLSGNLDQRAAGTLTFTGSGTTLVSGNITQGANSTGLLKTGSGTVILSNAANAYTGTTTVRNGTLQINANAPSGANGALGNSATAVVVNDASTSLSMNTSVLLGAANVTVNRMFTIGSQGATTTLGGLNTTGTSTFTGAITLNKGVSLTAATGGTTTFSGQLTAGTGTQDITKIGGGTVLLSNANNNYNGATTISAGTLRLGVAGAIPNASAVFMNGASTTFDLNNITETIGSLGSSAGLTTATVSLGTATLTAGGNNTTTQFDGTITGTGALIKAGTGTMTLTGNNTYSGATTVTAGTLIAGSNNALGFNAGGTTTTVNTGATLGVQGGSTIASETIILNGTGDSGEGALHNVSGNNTITGTVRLGTDSTIKSDGGTLTLSTGGVNSNGTLRNITFSGGGNTLVSGVLGSATAANNIGTLTKNGSGTLTLSNANLFNGVTTVNAGVVEMQHAAALGDGTIATTVNTGGTLALSNNINVTSGEDITINGEGASSLGALRNISGNNTLGAGSNVVLGSAGTAIGADGASSLTVAGVISGAQGFTKVGSGTLVVSGANTYTGVTTVRNGTLTTTANVPVSAAGGFGNAASTIQVGDADTTASDNLAVLLGNAAGGQTANRAFSINNYGSTATLGGTNTAGTNTFNGTIAANRELTLTSAAGGTVNYAGVVSGNGGLVVTGSGTTALNGTNTYTGTTTLRSGTLTTTGNAPVSASGAFGNSATAIEVGDSGTAGGANLSLLLGNAAGGRTINRALDINNYGNTVTVGGTNTSGTNTFGGDVALGKNVSLASATGGTVAFTGAISGTGGITASGTGTVVLSGNNSFDGATTVNSGATVVAASANALGSTAAGTTVISGGTLGLQGNVTIPAGETLTISGTGVGGVGALRGISGDNTVGGNIALGGATTIGNTTAGTTLTVNGVISGAQNLTTTGAGDFSLRGANTNSGTLTLNGSAGSLVTLEATAGQALGSVTNITINAGNTLMLGGANQINDNATLTLAGGTFNVGSFSETMRSVSQNTAASTIDFLNDGSVLRFNGVNGVSSGLGTIAGGTLTIANWAGSLNGSGTEQLVIYSPSAPTLTNINFANWGTGNNAIAIARADLGAGFYELLPNATATDWNVNGNGTWTTGANWVGGVAPNGAAAIVRFGNLGSAAPLTANPTVNVTANQTVNKLLFDNSGNRNYTVSSTNGSRVDLSANALINVNDNGSHLISVAGQHAGSTTVTNNSTAATGLTISGTMTQMANSTLTFNGDGNTLVSGAIVRSAGITNLVKTGTGTLTLSNLANSYTGTTTLRGGTLQVNANVNSGANGVLGNAATAIVVNDAQTTSTMNTSLLIGANGTTFGRAITVGSQGGITTIGGNFGAGTASNFTQTITLNKGVTLTAAGGNVGFAGALTAGTGTQDITKEGTGVVILSNTGNNFNGTTTINAGTLQLGAAGVLPDGTAVTMAGANTTLALSNFNETIGSLAGAQTTANVNLGSATLTTGGNNTNTQYDGTISGTGQLVKNGTGTMTLTGNNSYTGATTVNTGTLVAAHNNALGTNAGATSTAAGATLGLQGNITVTGETLNAAATTTPTAASLANLSGNNTWTGNLSLTGGTANDQVRIDAAAGSQLTIDGVISQATNAKAITKTGSGTVILSGAADNTFTGATNVNGGTLVIAKNNALGASGTAATTTVAVGATLGVQGNVTVTSNKSFSLAGAAMPPATPSLQNISGTNTLNGNITLTGAANTGVAIDSANGSSLTLNGAITQATANNAVTKTGLGSLTLSGTTDNTFAGGFTIDDGTVYAAKTAGKDATGRADVTIGNGDLIAAALVLNASNQIRDTSDVTVKSDGQLNLQTFSDTIGSLTMGGGSVTGTGTLTLSGDLTFNGTGSNTALISSNLDLGGNRLAQINNNGQSADFDLTISGVVSGAGSTLTKAGSGTLLLTGANTYGATSITGGTLQIGNGGTTGTLGSGAVTNDGALIFNRSDSSTVGNIISGSGTVAQSGSGTTIFTGANTYSGTTTINSGTLQIGNGGTTGSLGTGNVTNNGALTFNRSNALTVANAISGTGSLAQSGAGTTTLTGANTYTGATTISSGTLQVGNGGTTGSLGTGAITNSGTLAINRSNAYTVGGAIGGTGAFTQAGSGTTTFTANNTYSGTTTISAGTLQVGAGGTTGTLGTGSVVNNAALSFNRSDSYTAANAISGSGTLTKAGSGTTILTGSNSYSGTTTISAGTLQIGNGGTTGSLGSGAVTNNGALVFNRSNALTVGNTIGGSGSLVKSGSGTTTLTAANTYSGATTVNGGTLAIQNASALGTTAGGTTVGSGATLALSNNIAVGAESVSLQGGTLENTSGTNSLAGPLTLLAASQVNVASGSLTLGGAIGGSGFDLTLGGGAGTDIFLTGSVAMGGGTLIKQGGGTLHFDSDFSFGGNLTLAGGTVNLAGADISVGTLRITGNTILDFGNSANSTLNVGSLYIASGVTVTINNWTQWNDIFATLGWQNNAGQDITPSVPHEVPNAPPVDQIDFSGWTNDQTHWDASNEITPTPEPSTYGAILLSILTGLAYWRRRKALAANRQ